MSGHTRISRGCVSCDIIAVSKGTSRAARMFRWHRKREGVWQTRHSVRIAAEQGEIIRTVLRCIENSAAPDMRRGGFLDCAGVFLAWQSRVIAGLMLGAWLFGAAHAEPLTLAYAHRPGYADMINGKPKGLSIEIAARAAKAANLDVSWALMVQPRQMAMLQRHVPNFCAIGLFKTPEREALGQFSNAYYRDRPYVVVVSRAAARKVRGKASFALLLRDSTLELGLLDSLSYGTKIDDMLKARGAVRRIEGKIEQVFKMVASGRLDYTIASPEEVGPILDLAGIKRDEVEAVSYPDMPDGNLRYFLCSKAVEQAVMDRLNAGIAALKLDLH